VVLAIEAHCFEMTLLEYLMVCINGRIGWAPDTPMFKYLWKTICGWNIYWTSFEPRRLSYEWIWTRIDQGHNKNTLLNSLLLEIQRPIYNFKSVEEIITYFFYQAPFKNPQPLKSALLLFTEKDPKCFEDFDACKLLLQRVSKKGELYLTVAVLNAMVQSDKQEAAREQRATQLIGLAYGEWKDNEIFVTAIKKHAYSDQEYAHILKRVKEEEEKKKQEYLQSSNGQYLLKSVEWNNKQLSKELVDEGGLQELLNWRLERNDKDKKK
jgi:hypothetical protein